MSQYGYIYKTMNLLNGKIYIGQHKGLFDRSYLGSGTIIKKAIKLHGIENFKVEPIAYAFSNEELDRLEIFYISEYRNQYTTEMIYNISNGGEAPMSGRFHTQETKIKMSGSRTGESNPMFGRDISGDKNPMFGRKHSDETKQKISKELSKVRGSDHGNFGKVKSAETLLKMKKASQGNKNCVGRVMSEETRKKISDKRKKYYETHTSYWKGKKLSAESRKKMSDNNWKKKKCESLVCA